jgi:hypothetical protein
MTYFETLTLLLALLSNVIAFTAFYRSKRVADRQLEFEALQAELAAYSLKQRQEGDAKRKQGAISIETGLRARGLYNLNIRNISEVPIFNIRLTMIDQYESSPLMSGEEKKFPIQRLDPGITRSAAFVTHMQCSFPFSICVEWNDPDGTERKMETVLDHG